MGSHKLYDMCMHEYRAIMYKYMYMYVHISFTDVYGKHVYMYVNYRFWGKQYKHIITPTDTYYYKHGNIIQFPFKVQSKGGGFSTTDNYTVQVCI